MDDDDDDDDGETIALRVDDNLTPLPCCSGLLRRRAEITERSEALVSSVFLPSAVETSRTSELQCFRKNLASLLRVHSSDASLPMIKTFPSRPRTTLSVELDEQ